MKNNFVVKNLLCLSLGLLVSLTSCSSQKKISPATNGDNILVSNEAETLEKQFKLLNLAEKYFQKGLYSLARDKFLELYTTYPFGPYSTLSQLKAADSLMYNKDYTNAISEYDRFSKEHPSLISSEYSQFKSAVSTFSMTSGIGRDPTPFRDARKKLLKFLNDKPNSVYSPVAKILLNECIEALRSHELLVADYYSSKNFLTAAKARLDHRRKFSKKTEIDKLTVKSNTQDVKKVGLIEKPRARFNTPISPTLSKFGEYSNPKR